ncbi:MAG: hypothetical protein ACLFXM_00370 [Acidimicrobiia bacterium]
MNQHTQQRAGRSASLRNILLVGAVAAMGLVSPAAAGASAIVEGPLVESPTAAPGPTFPGDEVGIPQPCDDVIVPCPVPEDPCESEDPPEDCEPEDPCEGEDPPEDCDGEPGGGEEEPEPDPEPEPVPEATVDPPVLATPNFTG